MGMAASQARLLSITTRLSDNELRSQLINNAKMRLATESSSVSEAYIAALNDTTYMFTNYDSDNNATYQTLTFNSLTAYNEFNTQYGLSNAAGQILVSETDGANFEKSSDLTSFLACYGLEYRTTYFETLSKTAGSGATCPTVYDDDYVCYQSLFTVDELEEFYSTYDTVLMSSAFNDYLTLEETYIDAREAYYDSLEDYVDDVVKAETVKTSVDSSTTLSTFDTYIDAGTADSSASTYYTAFQTYYTAVCKSLLGDDYEDSDYYTTLTEIYNENDPTNSYEEDYDYVVDEDTGTEYIYLENDLRINLTEGTVESIHTESTTTENDDGTTTTSTNTSWTSDVSEWDNDDYYAYASSDDTSDENLVSLYQYNNNTLSVYGTYEETITNSEGDDETILVAGTNSTYSYSKGYCEYSVAFDTSDTSDGTVTGTVTNNTSNKDYMYEEYFYALSYLYNNYFCNTYTNAFVYTDAVAEACKDSTEYTNYVEASLDMEEFIFGKTGVLDFEQYQYLDDYRALLLSMTYSDDDDCEYVDTGLTYTYTYVNDDGETVESTDPTDYEHLLAALKDGTLVIRTYTDENGDSQTVSSTINPDYLNVIKAYEMETIISIYGEPSYAYIKDGDYDSNGDAEAEWYTNLYNRMCEGYMVLEDGLASSAEWIQYALESGLVKLEQVDSDGEWNAITYTSCSDITETTDDTAVTLAEAEYTKAMNKIEAKDKIYDLELKNIDTEHEALQTEYDSIKNAMDKNIERNFKLYS